MRTLQTIKARVIAAFVVLALLTTLVGVIGVIEIRYVTAGLRATTGKAVPALGSLALMHQGLTFMRLKTRVATIAVMSMTGTAS